ncbi:N-lysine methyltransferase SMYD2-like [Amphiura filiformis]|uniref:N-lysine methyltransferase SMYD2-like n=1 Tax=Amphiura filiformis TaxID=82378 RepID=UPI003B214CD6
MEIRSLRDIQPGEECFIHYVNVLQTVNVRRKKLYDNYRFWCECLRCKRELKILADTAIGDRLKLEETEAKAQTFLAKIDKEFDENYYKMLETCETGLDAVQNDLDTTNPHMAQLHVRTQEACIGLQKWKAAVKSGMEIIRACKTHLLPTDPILGFHMWRVAKIQAVTLNQPIVARDLLQQAIDVMSIGYGSTHPMTMEAKELLGTIIDQ